MFDKQFVFITGAPRTGTSMVTKIIDSHPDSIILMENIFGNRKRHFHREDFWNHDDLLKEKIRATYSGFTQMVLGNKVITPDVWAVEDIYRFCNFFENFKIVFLVRDPIAVVASRLKREPADFLLQFNESARKNLLLNFSTRTNAYLSSWRQSIENYWKLKEAIGSKIKLIYYENFCNDFENQLQGLFDFLELQICPEVVNWYAGLSHDFKGVLQSDLKYPDEPVFKVAPVLEIPDDLITSVKDVAKHYDYWRNQEI
jgi:hypothetical protein